MASSKYLEKRNQLLRAIDIAIEVYTTLPSNKLKPVEQELCLKSCDILKLELLHSEPRFQNLASLKYDEQELFTKFNEFNDNCVELFWKRIHEENLPFVRKDLLIEIIRRGKIRNHNEYDVVVDTAFNRFEEGKLSSMQMSQVNEMIADYEKKKR